MEERGLSEVGIYRVSGSKNEIKNLKERILRGKALPNLSSVDVHVLCGCIKDFLRGLREPLIPTNLWTTFSNAVQMIEDAAIERELFAAVDQLPQANRDTLAFLILHLQRFVIQMIYFSLLYVLYSGFQLTVLPKTNLLKCQSRTWPKSSDQLCWDFRMLNQDTALF